MRRVSWYVGLVIGLLLVVAAPVLRWAVAPAVSVLPGGTDTLRVYTGTASTVINPSVTRGTLFGPALLHDQPVTVLHRVTVEHTSGKQALVADHQVVAIPGATVATVNHSYAVDRKSLARGSGFDNVTVQSGQTFNWPINTAKKDYVGWVADTHSTTTLKYAGTATRGGMKTYVFTANVPTTRVTDTAMLAALPSSMPKSLLNSMVPSLGLTVDQLKQLAAVMPNLPDPVPFAYLFSATSTYWVAPATGVVVDVSSHEVRTAAFLVGAQVVPVGPVLDVTYSSPAQTVKGAAADAKNGAARMNLVATTLPISAGVTGLVLLVICAFTARAARRRPAASPPAIDVETLELTPVG